MAINAARELTVATSDNNRARSQARDQVSAAADAAAVVRGTPNVSLRGS